MKTLSLTLNGRTIDFEAGRTILEVALANGVHIPTLCHLEGCRSTGSCRICLVEVAGARSLVASCSTPADNGMVIQTDSERVLKSRKLTVELLLARGTHNCITCEKMGNCTLQDLAYSLGVDEVRFTSTSQLQDTEDANPFIIRDFSRCILCGRCVQACQEVVVNQAISFGYRGPKAKIIAGPDVRYEESDCVFCGQCVQVCPVGALVEKKGRFLGREKDVHKVRTTCPYCGTGCQQLLHVKGEQIVKITGVEDGAPNYGKLCVKGRFAYDFIYSEDRLSTPLIREKDGEFREASWDEALDLVASKFKEIIAKHGPDAVAGISCARSINEDSYNMQKLFRAVFQTNNIDHCARVCHAPTVAGLAASFGSGAGTNSIAEFKDAKMFSASERT
jgi:predicted molibdopterin-dependent oxidoreductase YjgC